MLLVGSEGVSIPPPLREGKGRLCFSSVLFSHSYLACCSHRVGKAGEYRLITKQEQITVTSDLPGHRKVGKHDLLGILN